MIDYLKACEQLPPKPRFTVGQRVRIVGPSLSGCTKRTGEEVAVEAVSVIMTMEVTKSSNDKGYIYSASSLALASEVPAPKYKRGDKVVYGSCPGKTMILEQIKRVGDIWLWKCPLDRSELWYSENTLSPAPAEPVYLPTRWVNVDRTQNSLGYFESGYARVNHDPSIRRGRDTIILHDMPADENGVQVDFVTLTRSRYSVHGSPETGFFVNLGASSLSMVNHSQPIDAWRDAARHYLESRSK